MSFWEVAEALVESIDEGVGGEEDEVGLWVARVGVDGGEDEVEKE